MDYFLRAGVGNIVVATVLAVAAAAVGPWIRRWPALRHCLWLLVLVKLVTPPLWTMPVSWLPTAKTAHLAPHIFTQIEVPASDELRADLDSGVAAPIVLDDTAESWSADDEVLDPSVAEAFIQDLSASRAAGLSAPSIPWVAIVFAVWAVGAAAALVISCVRIIRFSRLLRQASPAGEIVEDQVEELAGALGLRRRPRVCWMTGTVSPMVWALGTTPRLILPEGLWKRLDKAQRSTLLAHELAHLRRGDHWIRCLELVVTALYWWFPIVWWTRTALRDAEEQCCDAWVVWVFPGQARKYAEALLETVDYLSPAAPAAAMSASGLGHVRQLRRRLTMIMQGTARRSLHWSGSLFALGLSAALLPLAPTWAQDPKPTPEKESVLILQRPEQTLDLVASTSSDVAQDLVLALDPTNPNADVDVEVALVLDQDGSENAAKVKKQIDEAIAKLEDDLKRAAKDVDSQAKKQSIEAGVQQLRAVRQAQNAERSAREAIAKQVQEQLKQAMEKTSDPKAKEAIEAAIRKLGERRNEERRVELRVERLDKVNAEAKSDKAPELSPEKKAEIDKARAEFEELRAKSAKLGAELKDLSHKMREAQSRLSKLLAESRATQIRSRIVEYRARPRATRSLSVDGKEVTVEAVPGGQKGDVIVRAVPGLAGDRLMRGLGNPDQDRRLSELEKKLDRLADELAKLRKSKD
jgi:beta-lactamase regulating signal transducer with metallopeptidase domain